MRLRRDVKIPFANDERAWSDMLLRIKLNTADTWSEEVEALVPSWQKFPPLYDVADKLYHSHVLKERTFREIAEEINL